MRKLLIAATALTALISGEAIAGTKYTTSSTISYNGITYNYSSTSTCSDGTAALRLYRKWWCPATSSTTSASTTSSGTTSTTTSTSGTTSTSSTTTSSTTTTSSGTTSTSTTTTTAPVSYNANISWTIPSTRADGTPLAVTDLSGYEVYYTNDTGSVNVTVPVAGGGTVNTVVSSLASGNYYFSISAIDTSGLKSVLSTVASLSFP